MTAMFFEYGSKETDWLARWDKRMAEAIEHFGVLQRGMVPDLFAALVRNIVDQQISTKAGLTVNARLLALAGAGDSGMRHVDEKSIVHQRGGQRRHEW